MLKEFQELGLSYYESKLLDAVLKEKLSVRELCKKARIPLGKVYSIIKSLREKDLIEETESRPKEIYVLSASVILNKLIKKKERKDESLLAELRYLASQVDSFKKQPSKFFEIGTNIEDNKRIQLRSFVEAEKEVCQILNTHHKPQSNRESKTIWEREIERAVMRGVIFRVIYPKSVVVPKILRKLPKEKFKMKRLDTSFIRCDIIDKKRVLIKLVHEDAVAFGGIIFIENEKLAKNLQSIFEEFWEQAEEL